MLKPVQTEPSWNYVSQFIIYFSHFPFSAISQTCFHVRWKLVLLHNHSIWQAFLQVFKQLWNHSFICGVCMLLKHVTVPWCHCKLASYCVFKCWTLSNKQDQNIAKITGSESAVFLNKHAPSASLLFEVDTVPFQSRLNNDVWEVVW